MKIKKYVPEILFILLALAVGGLSSIATNLGMPVYEQAVKPPLNPPAIVFPIVWTVLYILMGISARRIWKSSDPKRGCALAIYAVQLLCNGLWPVFFFGLHAYLFSFIWLLLLWVLIIVMIRTFYRIDHIAGLLQIPYLVWVSFAGYLNLAVWLLNY